MAETENLLVTDGANMENIRHRVQRKIAGAYLEVIDPDALDKEKPNEKYTLSQNMDSKTQQKFEKKFEKYRTKDYPYSIQNILWFIGSIALFYYTDFYVAVRYDPRVNRLWFNIGAILILINIGIAGFLIVYLSWIKKMSSDDWEKTCPAAIPIATGAFIMGGVCVTVGLWPVWNIFTPFMLFTFFMGFVVTVAMIPNF